MTLDASNHSVVTIRSHRPGDLGWIVYRHGYLYSQEYGWNQKFEALVALIAAKFLENHDPQREHCWLAEYNGETVGSIMLVKDSDEVAKLRLLLVEPHARGLGVAAKLVDQCLSFARNAQYRKVTLWTNSVLITARRLYERIGFRLIAEHPLEEYGHGLMAQIWELTL